MSWLRLSSPITKGSDSDLSFPCSAPDLLASRLKLTPKWFCITALTLITVIFPLELLSQRRISHSITENLFHWFFVWFSQLWVVSANAYVSGCPLKHPLLSLRAGKASILTLTNSGSWVHLWNALWVIYSMSIDQLKIWTLQSSLVHQFISISSVVDITHTWLSLFIQTLDVSFWNDNVDWFFQCTMEESCCRSFLSMSVSVKEVVISFCYLNLSL